MIKTYNFKTIKKNNDINIGSSTDYSKILDNIIVSDIIDKNKYLFTNNTKKYNDSILLNDSLYDDSEFIKAAKFLANYKGGNKYIIGKTYTASDGTPIVFYDDEIQIGFDNYKYSDLIHAKFLDAMNSNIKKIIIKIYGNAKININLL